MHAILKDRKEIIRNICKELQVKRLYAFGSVLTDKFNYKSDIDFLLSFKDNISVEDYTDNYFELHYKLREIFDREIDILTEYSLSNKALIENINNNRELIYESKD